MSTDTTWRVMPLPDGDTARVRRGSIGEAMFMSIPGFQPAGIPEDEATWLGDGGAPTKAEQAEALA